MSMLAERKVKQKWSLNPRGKAWAEDSNNFGQKMLEKMGWSKGKGLGPKENGIVDHVKVAYKNDSKGMGFKERDNQWTEHDSNFSALLESLSGVGAPPPETPIKVSSLELKSQSSKVRLHYKKFTRGKDLSRCSEKDLANIFGKRSLKQVPKLAPPEIIDEKKDSFSHNGGSMVDYFKKKLPNYGKNNSYVVGSNGVLKKGSESEDESRVGFGFAEKKRKSVGESNGTPKKIKKEEEDQKGLSNPAFDPLFGNVEVQKHFLNTIEEESEDLTKINKKKKKNTAGSDENSDCQKKNKAQNFESQDSFTNGDFEMKRKKKKEKIDSASFDVTPEVNQHKKTKNEDASGIDNPNFANLNGDKEESCHNNDFEVKRKKKKNEADSLSCQNSHVDSTFEVKRKKKSEDSSALDNPNFDSSAGDCQTGFVDSNFEVTRKKKQKKNEDSLAIDNPNFDSSAADSQNSYVDSNFEVKRRKKEKKNENSLAIDNPNFDNSAADCQNSYVDSNFEVKRKKKEKKNEDSLAIDNPNFDSSAGDCHNSYVNSNFKVKRKKKEKRNEDSLAIDNPNFDSSAADCQNSYVDSNFVVKRTKKNEDSLAIDNPNFDSSSRDCQNSYVDSNFEVKRKKKKKKNEDQLAIDNPNFDSSSGGCDSYVDSNFEVKRNEEESSNTSKKNTNEEAEPSFDLILNVTSTPSLPKPASSAKRRKSVRFSSVNEERIIPNIEDIENRNELFDINSRVIANGLKEENLEIEEISKKIDGFQAEIENDINEAKVNRFVGEVGDPDGENEKLPEGTKLKFKYAKFGRFPGYANKSTSRARTSYKHLIKGDIILGFNNTNLHEIVGYGVKK